jgi:Ca2+-binding RTX toxin-like protein
MPIPVYEIIGRLGETYVEAYDYGRIWHPDAPPVYNFIEAPVAREHQAYSQTRTSSSVGTLDGNEQWVYVSRDPSDGAGFLWQQVIYEYEIVETLPSDTPKEEIDALLDTLGREPTFERFPNFGWYEVGFHAGYPSRQIVIGEPDEEDIEIEVVQVGDSDEGNPGDESFLEFEIRMSAPDIAESSVVTVDYEVEESPLHVGVDYEDVSGTVSFEAGATNARETIRVPITGDEINESDLEVTLRISDAQSTGSETVTLTEETATATIFDDDSTTVSVSGPIEVSEGHEGPVDGRFEISLEGSELEDTQVVNVDYRIEGAASIPHVGSRIVRQGEASYVDIPVQGDTEPGPDRDVTITISNATSSSNANIRLGESSATTKILNDDTSLNIGYYDLSPDGFIIEGLSAFINVEQTTPIEPLISIRSAQLGFPQNDLPLQANDVIAPDNGPVAFAEVPMDRARVFPDQEVTVNFTAETEGNHVPIESGSSLSFTVRDIVVDEVFDANAHLRADLFLPAAEKAEAAQEIFDFLDSLDILPEGGTLRTLLDAASNFTTFTANQVRLQQIAERYETERANALQRYLDSDRSYEDKLTFADALWVSDQKLKSSNDLEYAEATGTISIAFLFSFVHAEEPTLERFQSYLTNQTEGTLLEQISQAMKLTALKASEDEYAARYDWESRVEWYIQEIEHHYPDETGNPDTGPTVSPDTDSGGGDEGEENEPPHLTATPGPDRLISAKLSSDTIDGGTGNDTLISHHGKDILNGGAGNDALYDQTGWSLLDGGDGNDIMSAGNGRDTLVGGAGNDTMTGGHKADTFRLGDNDGHDVITDFDVERDILVFESVRFGSGEGETDPETFLQENASASGRDVVISFGEESSVRLENILELGAEEEGLLALIPDLIAAMVVMEPVAGSSGSDTLTGTQYVDNLSGGSGGDSLIGQAGNDNLVGGRGHDTLIGSEGIDLLKGGSGKDSIEGGTGDDIIRGNHGKDTLMGGDGDDDIRDWAGWSLLDGGRGNDVLKAGNGRDTLIGGDGNDTLTGGKKGDVFRFGENSGEDILTDFEIGVDVLDITDHDLSSEGQDADRESARAFLEGSAQISGEDLWIDLGEGRRIRLVDIVDEETGDKAEDYVEVFFSE